jgi:hypothetical protein
MKNIKKFDQFTENVNKSKESIKLNELKIWSGDKEGVINMQVIFEDDDEAGYIPYLLVNTPNGKYYTKLKNFNSKDNEDDDQSSIYDKDQSGIYDDGDGHG